MEPTLAKDRQTGALAGILADDLAFRAWYDATLPRVYGYVFTRCGRNADLAMELTQQTFVDAIRTHERSATEDPSRWILGIARHRLVDHFRALERRERGYLRLLRRSREPAVTWLGESDPDDTLVDAVRRLPTAQRAAIVLRYLDDLPVRDVARLLDRSEGAVESLLSRGREALRGALEKTNER